jgi:hypothetical protein
MSAFVPPLFKKFGKSLDDLLKKKYGAKKDLKVKNTTSDGTVRDLQRLRRAGHC